jgi:hypothetical protein
MNVEIPVGSAVEDDGTNERDLHRRGLAIGKPKELAPRGDRLSLEDRRRVAAVHRRETDPLAGERKWGRRLQNVGAAFDHDQMGWLGSDLARVHAQASEE